MKSREDALKELLKPIKWSWSSSIYARQNLVSKRHAAVDNVYPFLTDEEKQLADAWFEKESYSGLWD